MKKSIMKMLEALSPAARGAEEAPASPAEKLGQAMLTRLGISADDGELIDALIEEWGSLPLPEEAPEEPETEDEPETEPEEPEDEPEDESEEPEEPEPAPDPAELEELEELFRGVRRPVPMRTGSAASRGVDYQDMSAKQFAELKKLIRRADADGKRIKL